MIAFIVHMITIDQPRSVISLVSAILIITKRVLQGKHQTMVCNAGPKNDPSKYMYILGRRP